MTALHAPIGRAKPLNAATRAAIPRGIEVWDDEIEYLRNAIDNTTHESLLARHKAKLADLERARAWLQSKLESTEE